MNLSEAIKAGAKLRPQTFGAAIGRAEDGSLGTCAIGAAGEFAGVLTIGYSAEGMTVSQNPGRMHELFPLLMTVVEAKPCGCDAGMPSTVAATAVHLNDYHHWRRETIAQWVKTLEDGK